MALPTFTITHDLSVGDGTAHEGKVTIAPNAVIDDPDTGTTFGAWDVQLVAGAFTTTAPAEGAGGVTGLAYTVTYHLKGARLGRRTVPAQAAGTTYAVHQHAPVSTVTDPTYPTVYDGGTL